MVRVAVNWLMGEENLDPPWEFGPKRERFEVEVKGDPDCHVDFHGLHPATIEAGLERNPGIVATALHCVNAIPYVCDAPARPADVPRPAAGDRPRPPGPRSEPMTGSLAGRLRRVDGAHFDSRHRNSTAAPWSR